MKLPKIPTVDGFVNNIHLRYRKDWLDPKEVAEILGVSTETLYRSRAKRTGIPFMKFGAKVAYLKKDVIDYLEGCYVQTNADDC